GCEGRNDDAHALGSIYAVAARLGRANRTGLKRSGKKTCPPHHPENRRNGTVKNAWRKKTRNMVAVVVPGTAGRFASRSARHFLKGQLCELIVGFVVGRMEIIYNY